MNMGQYCLHYVIFSEIVFTEERDRGGEGDPRVMGAGSLREAGQKSSGGGIPQASREPGEMGKFCNIAQYWR